MRQENIHISDELLVKYLMEEASLDEIQAVEKWLGSNEEGRKHFGQMKKAWEYSNMLAATSVVDENEAWKRFEYRTRTKEDPNNKIPWISIAALFILFATGAWLALQYYKTEPAPPIALHSGNAVHTDTLVDGSIITLNKNSIITYNETFNKKERKLSLKGEAFFNVHPNKSKPFEVTINDVTVRVMGTSFNVKSEGGVTEVIVESGIVRVIRNNQSVDLRPRQKLVIGQMDSVLKPQSENGKLYNYYRSREFVCDNTPLWKLVEVLNEAYDVHIKIQRPELRPLALDVTFSNESLDMILNIIRETFNNYNIKITRSGNIITLQ